MTASPRSSLARAARTIPARRGATWRRSCAATAALGGAAAAEPAEAQVTEVAGWVVPQSVALYAALAAQA